MATIWLNFAKVVVRNFSPSAAAQITLPSVANVDLSVEALLFFIN